MASFTHVVTDYAYTLLFVIKRENDCGELSAVEVSYGPLYSPSSYPSASSPSVSGICPP